MRHRLASRLLCVVVLLALTGATRAAHAEESPVTTQAHKMKSFALNIGMRAGVFIPSGGLYADRTFVTTPFRDVATAGPALELDLGARFAQYFVGYLLFEQAFLSRGTNSAWTVPHGGEANPSTQAAGLGLRWESNPSALGLIADVAFAHRWFTARWSDSTAVRMEGPGEIRLGFGLGWRVGPQLALAPMVTVLTGTFTDRTLDGRPLGDMSSSYAAAALTISGQADL